MKQCPSCQNWIDYYAAFCPVCGRQQAQPPSPHPARWNQPTGDDADRTQPTQPMHRQGPRAGVPPTYPNPPPTYHPAPLPPSMPVRPAGWKSPNTYRWLVIGLGLLFLCAAGLAVLTLWSAAARGTSRVAEQVNDFFSDPLEAVGIAPSETPLPPTPTPWPTFTPVPQESGEESESGFQVLSAACAGALDHLKQVSDTFTQSPTSVFNGDWRAEARLAMDETRAACGSLESASPVPGQVQEVQRLLALTSEAYDAANQTLKEGIDERRPGKVWEAVQQFYQAIRYLNETIQALGDIGQGQ